MDDIEKEIKNIKSVSEMVCIMNDEVFEENEEIRAGIVTILREIASGLEQTEDTGEIRTLLNKLRVVHYLLDFDDGSGSQTMRWGIAEILQKIISKLVISSLQEQETL